MRDMPIDQNLQQSLEMHKSNDDKAGEALTLSILGRNELKCGNLQLAQKYPPRRA